MPPIGYIFKATAFLLGLAAFFPSRSGDLSARPDPAVSYADAVSRAARQQAVDDSVASPSGRTILLTHGHRTARAVVLLHGFTNSPRQFLEIANELFAAGDNVYVPRLPHHAEDHGAISVLARITAPELRDCADSAVDIADALGDTVIVAGLSAGGTMAAWVGQYRPDVRRVVIIAPALEVTHVPSLLQGALINLDLRIPNVSHAQAVDTTEPDRNKGFATHAVGQILRLGGAVRSEARQKRPAVNDVVFLLNANDHTVAAPPALELAREWSGRGAHVRVYELPDSLRLPHDVVDERQPTAKPAIMHPLIEGLVSGLAAPRWVQRPLPAPVITLSGSRTALP